MIGAQADACLEASKRDDVPFQELIRQLVNAHNQEVHLLREKLRRFEEESFGKVERPAKLLLMKNEDRPPPIGSASNGVILRKQTDDELESIEGVESPMLGVVPAPTKMPFFAPSDRTGSHSEDDSDTKSDHSDMSKDFWGDSVHERWGHLTAALSFRADNENLLFQVHNAWTRASEDCERKLRNETSITLKNKSVVKRPTVVTRQIRKRSRSQIVLDGLRPIRILPRGHVRIWMMGGWSWKLQAVTPFIPDGGFRGSWDTCGFILIVYDLLMSPLTLAFDFENKGFSEGHVIFTAWLDLFMLGWWSFDILLCLSTGFYTAQGFLDMRPRAIVKQYVTTWFGLDAFVVSVDMFTILTSNARMGYLRLGKNLVRLPRFFRMIRLVRLFKVNERFKRYLRSSNSEFRLTLVGLGKMLITICLVNHYVACAWYFIGERMKGHTHRTESTWIAAFLEEDSTILFRYATSLHWSFTQFTPASMQIVPQNVFERVFNVLVIIVGMVTFSSFISSITNAMTHIRQITEKRRKEDALIRKYFQEHNISSRLATRCWYAMQTKRKVQLGKQVTEKDIPLMSSLPERMLDELRFERFSALLLGHPLFLNIHAVWPETINLIIKHAVSDTAIPAREEFLGPNKEVTSMFTVSRGNLRYVHEIGGGYAEQQEFVEEGEWACELAIWSIRATVAGAFITGQNGCELMLIHAAEFNRTMRMFPDVELRCVVAKYAERFVSATNRAAVDWENEDVLRNRPEDIVAMYEGAKDEVADAKHTVQELFVRHGVKRPYS